MNALLVMSQQYSSSSESQKGELWQQSFKYCQNLTERSTRKDLILWTKISYWDLNAHFSVLKQKRFVFTCESASILVCK